MLLNGRFPTKQKVSCFTHLCIRLGRAPGRPDAVQCVSVRRGNTGRQHLADWWLCPAESQRLGLNDLSVIGLTAVLWVSARYVDTCEQPRYVRQTSSSNPCTDHAQHQIQLCIQTHTTMQIFFIKKQYHNCNYLVTFQNLAFHKNLPSRYYLKTTYCTILEIALLLDNSN